MRVKQALGWGLGMAVLSLLAPPAARADSVSGPLFYTTFDGFNNSGLPGDIVNVHTVTYNFNGSTFTLGASTNVAATRGADGILFAPDGHLIVGGQNNLSAPQLHEITTAGVSTTNVAAGTGSYHLALSSNASNAILYNLWNNEGFGTGDTTAISATQLVAGGLSTPAVSYTVNCAVVAGCSTDVRGLAFDPNNSTWYYDTAGDNALGTFGTATFNDVTHVATLTQLFTNVYAHGLTFDAFSGDIITSSANHVEQFAPSSGTFVADLIVGVPIPNGPTPIFDQPTVDGHGHLFVSSNSGYLTFVDYDGVASRLINGAGNFVASAFLAANLDDVAPLSGPGSNNPVPEPGSLVLLGTGLLGLARGRRWFRG